MEVDRRERGREGREMFRKATVKTEEEKGKRKKEGKRKKQRKHKKQKKVEVGELTKVERGQGI